MCQFTNTQERAATRAIVNSVGFGERWEEANAAQQGLPAEFRRDCRAHRRYCLFPHPQGRRAARRWASSSRRHARTRGISNRSTGSEASWPVVSACNCDTHRIWPQLRPTARGSRGKSCWCSSAGGLGKTHPLERRESGDAGIGGSSAAWLASAECITARYAPGCKEPGRSVKNKIFLAECHRGTESGIVPTIAGKRPILTKSHIFLHIFESAPVLLCAGVVALNYQSKEQVHD